MKRGVVEQGRGGGGGESVRASERDGGKVPLNEEPIPRSFYK